jgi:hypothetical protein
MEISFGEKTISKYGEDNDKSFNSKIVRNKSK